MRGIPALEDLVVAQFPKLPIRYNRRFREEFQAVYVTRAYKSFWQRQRRSQLKFIEAQHCTAKGHSKNR